MIINDKDAAARLNSPMNLINKLRNSNGNKKNSAMSLFIPPPSSIKTFNPFIEKEVSSAICDSSTASVNVGVTHPTENTSPVLNDILENHESQIKLGLAHDKALDLLNRSVEALSNKLDDVRADKLPSVISAASKTVESIRRERSEAAKNGKDREVHYHFYTPEQKKVADYEVIDVA